MATVIAPNAPLWPSRLTRARGVATDVFIVTAIVWAPPLALGALAALARWATAG